jgi:hypothetical protein
MKYSLKSIFAFAFLVAFTLVFTSCDKQNIDEVLEEVGNVPTNNIQSTTGTTITPVKPNNSNNTATIAFQGSSTVINAYASYCNLNNKEFLTVTNNQALLSNSSVFTINSNDLDNGDFIIAYAIDTTGATPVDFVVWSNMDTTQTPSLIDILIDAPNTLSFSVDPVLNSVKGNMSGTFTTGILTGNPANSPYTINFDANILQANTFCN